MGGEDGNFGQDGVIEGAGGVGQNEQKWVQHIMGDPNREQVVMFYGISSLVLAFVSLLMYLILNQRTWIVAPAGKWWFWIHELIWWPVGIIWIALAFYDAQWLRTIFGGLVQWSFLGPFAGYWVAIVYFLVKVDEHRTGKGKKGWSTWQPWVWLPFNIGYTIFAMIIQVGMVGKIFDWVENAPINENLPDDYEEWKPKSERESETADDGTNMNTHAFVDF